MAAFCGKRSRTSSRVSRASLVRPTLCRLQASWTQPGLLQSTQRAAKKVSPGNIAYYVILALRSGRRSTGYRKNDVLHPAAQLNGHARVHSMDEPVSDGEHGEESLTLHDCLAANTDDPAASAGRRLDWESVVNSLDRTAKATLVALSEDRELTLIM